MLHLFHDLALFAAHALFPVWRIMIIAKQVQQTVDGQKGDLAFSRVAELRGLVESPIQTDKDVS